MSASDDRVAREPSFAFGRGKVILLGEHGVVYGRPALAAGLSLGARAEADVATEDSLAIAPWGVHVVPDASSAEPLARAFAALLGTYTDDATRPHGPSVVRPAVRVRAAVELPGGAGLGCSAALAVAVLSAIDRTVGAQRTAEACATAALAWERVFHGNPSGVDSTMAAVGGVALYRKGAALRPFSLHVPLRLVIGNSGEPSSTKKMVESVARQHARTPAKLEDVFDAMEDLVEGGGRALAAGDHIQLGRLMDLNHALLNGLLVSTARLEEMCAAAREAGALGAKVTGAGGGGCMVALVEDEDSASRVKDAIAQLGRDAFVSEVRTERASA